MDSIIANMIHVVSLFIAIFFIYMLVGLFITFLICAAIDYIKIKNKQFKSCLREQALFYYVKKYILNKSTDKRDLMYKNGEFTSMYLL